MRQLVSVLIVSLGLAGCAAPSGMVGSTYVSTFQYQAHGCELLSAEAERLNKRAEMVASRLNQAVVADLAMVTVGLSGFWPALLAVGSSKAQEAELARIRGEAEALNEVAQGKKCSALVAQGAPAAAEVPSPEALAAR